LSNLVDTLWSQFKLETDEHFELIEPLLSEPEGKTRDGIAQLFRSFHSVKGLTRALDLAGLEAIAHRAENLLGLVREGATPFDIPVADTLLLALDTLRRLRDLAVETRQDQPPPIQLLAILDRLCFERAQEPAPASGGESAAPEAPAAALGEDAEMLHLFGELLAEHAPNLALVATERVAARAAEIAESAAALAHAAEVMGFELLVENLQQLAAIVSEDAERIDRIVAIGLLADIVTQIELVREVTGAGFDTTTLGRVLVGSLVPEGATRIRECLILLQQIELDLIEHDFSVIGTDAADLSRAIRLAVSIFKCVGHERTARLLLLLDDIFHRASQGELMPSLDLVALSREILETIDPRSVLDGSLRDTDLTPEFEEDLTERVRIILSALEADELKSTRGILMAGRLIKPELAAALTPEMRRLLGERLALPEQQLYEMLLQLDIDQTIGAGLVGWLSSEAKIITNRTVLVQEQSWFEFLVTTDRLPAVVVRQLQSLDPEHHCIRAVRRVTDEGVETLLGGASLAEQEAAAQALLREQAEAAALRPAEQDKAAGTVLRVRSEIIDRFMAQIGELRIAISELAAVAGDPAVTGALAGLGRLAQQLDAPEAAEVARHYRTLVAFQREIHEREQALNSLSQRLHTGALDLRVVPIDNVFSRLPRVVRDLARSQGKQVNLVMQGRDVRIDKSMVDTLIDPLLHMVRNAVDHGVELPSVREQAGKPPTATLTLRAGQHASGITVEVGDDGRGLDTAAILKKAIARKLVSEAAAPDISNEEIHRFIFHAGFSTAETVTETSGRGVGMDVVLTSIARLGGNVSIRTQGGRGTSFILQMPLSAALQNALLVTVGEHRLAIPERFIVGFEEVPRERMAAANGGQVLIAYRDGMLPVYFLDELIGFARERRLWRAHLPAVIVTNGRHTIGIVVDALHRREELFLRDLHPKLAKFPAISGVSVMGNGQIMLLLDGDALIQIAQRGGARDRVLAGGLP
jgi:two-component system, chemotaxis family, sensor kinase CheA